MTLPGKLSLYEAIGGDDGLDRLVQAFYDIIEQDEDAQELHLLHRRGHGVAHSRIEQFDYLSGFLGGPQHYVQRHGHSRLREIHEHVPIRPKMRDLWLKCMAKAVAEAGIAEPTASQLMQHLGRAAEVARNQD
ncbi:MAG: group II truncated hemoglobin [Aquamicrobium sp.]|jgi:hemoglobin|uniref:group II truncated hemoglobin n=1 Tax=Mesorhizobium sp. Pch-S TaxID=2082387 RepID=UPI00101211CF|nr:group II truncated hemoglobin [Mesorhizobium sp. Pch-S]MBR2691645.1 group II truncated hemoglobin [Aquamicrobium sp.]QAZ44680.1 globin [Mesorhizobium sp. Pch-S]